MFSPFVIFKWLLGILGRPDVPSSVRCSNRLLLTNTTKSRVKPMPPFRSVFAEYASEYAY